MNLNEYQKLCLTTAKKGLKHEEALCNWGLGVSGEAGDIASCIKKFVFHKNVAIKDGIRENIGDMMWYTAMICNTYGWNFEEVLEENIKKLKDRYPKGFTHKDAQRKGTMIKWSGAGEIKKVGGKR